MSEPKYRLVGNSVCAGDKDWPPLLRDNHASPAMMKLVVDALNTTSEHQAALALFAREAHDAALVAKIAAYKEIVDQAESALRDEQADNAALREQIASAEEK